MMKNRTTPVSLPSAAAVHSLSSTTTIKLRIKLIQINIITLIFLLKML